MDYFLVLKAGCLAFALCIGVLMLVFFVAGQYVHVPKGYYVKVFLPASVASFIAVYALLHLKMPTTMPDGMFYLSGCIGGWLSGLTYGATMLKKVLRSFLRG
jgi:hypothetical protein